LLEVIEERRRRLGDDLLSDLIRAEKAGDRLTSAELVTLIAGLVIAGSDTTVHALSFAVLDLLRHGPEHQLEHLGARTLHPQQSSLAFRSSVATDTTRPGRALARGILVASRSRSPRFVATLRAPARGAPPPSGRNQRQ
jgi:cytochrome P450